MNAMFYVRGNKRDYDYWAKLGNYGWSYEDVLPYFKKSEYMTDYYLRMDSKYTAEESQGFRGLAPVFHGHDFCKS